MNRRAKRNKYRKLLKKLEDRIAFFERLPFMENFFNEKKEIRILSCFESVDKYLGVPEDVAKNLSKNEVARQFAEDVIDSLRKKISKSHETIEKQAKVKKQLKSKVSQMNRISHNHKVVITNLHKGIKNETTD